MMPANRVALVTGGAKGIGRAIALALAERGFSVAIGYRAGAMAADETRAAITASGAAALALCADLARDDEAEALVRRVESEWGRIDALVHCAGPYHRVDLLAETPQGWRETFDGNLHSLFCCARAVAPGMIARKWGRIVAFSVAGADRLAPSPNVAAYTIAKAGVIALVRSLARALAPHGVTANVIAPGFIDAGPGAADVLARSGARIPAGRMGTPDEVVAAALFLLSDEASYVTGTTLTVSGGWGI